MTNQLPFETLNNNERQGVTNGPSLFPTSMSTTGIPVQSITTASQTDPTTSNASTGTEDHQQGVLRLTG